MTNQNVLFRSSSSNTDSLHTISIAAPLFLILLGSYILYKQTIEDEIVRAVVLLFFLGAVAWLAPLGSRLKHVEITEHGCTVFPGHGNPYDINFKDIERFSVSSMMGIIKLKISATGSLPADSVWFIPEIPKGKRRGQLLEELQHFLRDRILEPK